MAELTAARVEVEAAAAADAVRAAVAELEALRASSTDSSVSADDERDNELKLLREAAWEQAAQWAAVDPQGCRGGNPDGRGRAEGASGRGACGGRVDGDHDLYRRRGSPSRTGTMVTMGSRPLLGTSVPVAGGLLSPRPTTSSGPR
jgi:hypothetical protein